MVKGQVSKQTHDREHRKEIQEYHRKWRLNNPEKNRAMVQKAAEKAKRIPVNMCAVLQLHHDERKDDPERLTTKFILKMIRS